MSWGRASIAIGCGTAVAVAAGLALDATIGLPGFRGVTPPAPALITPGPPPEPAWEPATGVLADAAAAPPAGAPPIADVLDAAFSADSLGGRVGASVVDLSTGSTVYESGSGTPRTPASTLKILTAAAALQVLGPGHTFTTRVVTAPPGLDASSTVIVLVGGGDPTLTAAGDSSSGTALTGLADATAQALTAAGVTSVTLSFDDSMFTGPSVDPDWRPTYVSSGVVSPVSALSVDVDESRPSDPAQAAAARFADLLRARGVTVESAPARRTTAEEDAVEIAAAESAPLSAIVENILSTSDNDGAETLARHVAIGSGLPGSSSDASTAIVQALTSLGVDMSTTRVRDGSGLSRDSAVAATVITQTLALAADPSHPQLRAVITGLPVAGFSGTLDERFDDSASSGAGIVRAKTGTLTGVSGLAGVVVAASGVSYAFAMLADDVSNTLEARDALDDVAAAIGRCGCA